jgi:hypothetical protein
MTQVSKQTGLPSTRKRPYGTTIIEVAMALTILAIALPPLMLAFADASRQTILPANSAVAGFLAIEKMEEIVARRFRGTDGYVGIDSLVAMESPVSGFGYFTRTVSESFVNSSLAASASDVGYKKFTVTVTWESGAKQLAIEHIFADF